MLPAEQLSFATPDNTFRGAFVRGNFRASGTNAVVVQLADEEGLWLVFLDTELAFNGYELKQLSKGRRDLVVRDTRLEIDPFSETTSPEPGDLVVDRGTFALRFRLPSGGFYDQADGLLSEPSEPKWQREEKGYQRWRLVTGPVDRPFTLFERTQIV